MKKIITILLSLVLLLASSRGGGGDSSSSDKSKETEAPKIEKNIDAAAEALGLTGGEETMYAMIGATAGKEYNDGAVELYQFEEDSDAYKEIESSDSVSGIPVAAHKDGIALIFANNETDQAILDAFISFSLNRSFTDSL